MKRKGIILAGGSGTRLYPITKALSKQLLPVYDKPMIFYPLSILMLANIQEILVISTPEDLPQFKKLLGDGSSLGLRFEYQVQPKPEGLAQAFVIGKDFLDGAPSCLVLGDNMIFGQDFSHVLRRASDRTLGATICGYRVKDPKAYGVVEFDKNKKVLSIQEKPVDPKSPYAVPGIYFYDGQASVYAEQIKPSKRGELEITQLNEMYLKEGKLHLELLGRGTVWMDMGTHESLLDASAYVHTIQTRQGYQIANPDEIAFRLGWISREQLESNIAQLGRNGYAEYLHEIIGEQLSRK